MPSKKNITDLGEFKPSEGADPLQYLSSWTKDHGDTIRYKTALGNFYFFNHPSDADLVFKNKDIVRLSFLKMVLGEGLLSSEGPHWRKQRSIAMPHFTCGQVLNYLPLIVSEVNKMLSKWRDNARRKDTIDLARDVNLLTMNIILKAVYSYSLDDETDRALHEAISVLITDLSGLSKMAFIPEMTVSSTRLKTVQNALGTLEDVVEKILENRKRDPNPPQDFLHSLLNAVDRDTGKPLDKVAIRDEIVTTMISGNETTALVIAWAWSLLNHHPSAEEKLYQELDTVLDGRTPGAEDLLKLNWTDLVLKETMRLFPPVWIVSRRAALEVKVGEHVVKEGDSVILCPYTTHRHPEFWDSPELFNPARFASSDFGANQNPAYFPFGGGRHLCLGMHFALIEATIVMAMIGQQFRIKPVRKGIPAMDPGITLRLLNGYPVTLESI